MAWVQAPQYLWAGTTTDPRELLGNVFELAREINGYVDRDNVGENVITAAKVATGTFNTTGMTEFDFGTTDTIDPGETGVWKELDSLTTTVTTEDGRLHVDAFFKYGRTTLVANQQDTLETRLLIDGNVVDESGWISAFITEGSVYLVGSAPVSAGSHTISVQWRTRAHAWIYLDQIADGTFPSGAEVTANAETWTAAQGALVYRHQKR